MEDSIKTKKKGKKRSSRRSDEDEPMKNKTTQSLAETAVDFDPDEPTMGEKLAGLSPAPDSQISKAEIKPPTADSVHVLLKQALRAEDHALLLNCLYTKDEQVIRNSVSSLNPSDALKLLDSLLSMLHSRGAVLVCCIPWLKNLIVHHASSIISHPSSPSTLNTLYQLVDSRVSTFGSAMQLAACLDDVFAGVMDLDDGDEEAVPQPVIFEDWDSEEEGSDGSDNEEGGDDDDYEDDEDLGDVIDLPREHDNDDDSDV